MSQVKSFANELFFDIFEFSNTVLHSSRFNQLIYAHFQNHQFNLQSIAKEHFDIICQQHLSILTIVRVRVSQATTIQEVVFHFCNKKDYQMAMYSCIKI